ncbi:MAG: hypothetical protein ACI4KF_00170 [Huintestinicola sp.]
MPYPIITPDFYKEYTDKNNPEAKGTVFNVIMSPAAVEYSFPLNQDNILKKLMNTPEPLKYMMVNLKPEHEEEFAKNANVLIEKQPLLRFYWPLKSLMMNILQNRRYIFEKRMLILNFAMKTVQGMIDQEKEESIPEFVSSFTSTEDHDDVIKYFETIRPNFAYSLCDGLSFLRSLPTDENFDKVLYGVFKTANVDRSMKDFKFDPKKYIPVKKAYYEEFLKGKEHYIEHIMVNYVWTACMPFADYRYSLWENFVFYNSLFNAVKVMLTCYMYGRSDEDFIFAVKAFDTALSNTKGRLVSRAIEANNKEGLSTNGDMAILAMS